MQEIDGRHARLRIDANDANDANDAKNRKLMREMPALISGVIRSLQEVCGDIPSNLLALSSLSVPHFAVEPIRL
jgi:hypothetical protein